MLTSLVLLTTLPLVPTQTGSLELQDVQFTSGLFGPARSDNKYRPGDVCFMRFQIANVRVADTGKVRYRVQVVVRNARGEELFRQKPEDVEEVASLGGNSVPGLAQVNLGLKTAPGNYTVTTQVTDLASGKSAVVHKALQVLPKTFAIVRPQITKGGNAPAAPVAVVGEDLFVHFGVVEFVRDRISGQPSIEFEMRILDEARRMTLGKVFKGVINKDIPAKEVLLPLHFLVKLNRPGKFTVHIKASDQVSRKTADIALPIVVLKPPK